MYIFDKIRQNTLTNNITISGSEKIDKKIKIFKKIIDIFLIFVYYIYKLME